MVLTPDYVEFLKKTLIIMYILTVWLTTFGDRVSKLINTGHELHKYLEENIIGASFFL